MNIYRRRNVASKFSLLEEVRAVNCFFLCLLNENCGNNSLYAEDRRINFCTILQHFPSFVDTQQVLLFSQSIRFSLLIFLDACIQLRCFISSVRNNELHLWQYYIGNPQASNKPPLTRWQVLDGIRVNRALYGSILKFVRIRDVH